MEVHCKILYCSSVFIFPFFALRSILLYSCNLIGWPHSPGKIQSQASFYKIQKTQFLPLWDCLCMYVFTKLGTCLLLSLNIADFLTLLLLLEDQPTVAYSAGIKGNDHLDVAVAILHWARTLPVEIAVSK